MSVSRTREPGNRLRCIEALAGVIPAHSVVALSLLGVLATAPVLRQRAKRKTSVPTSDLCLAWLLVIQESQCVGEE